MNYYSTFVHSSASLARSFTKKNVKYSYHLDGNSQNIVDIENCIIHIAIGWKSNPTYACNLLSKYCHIFWQTAKNGLDQLLDGNDICWQCNSAFLYKHLRWRKITCLLKANNCSLKVKGWKINGMDVSLKYHLSGSDLIHFMCVSGKCSAF